jgi:hypothetical protein
MKFDRMRGKVVMPAIDIISLTQKPLIVFSLNILRYVVIQKETKKL